jgi:hypothetical protein
MRQSGAESTNMKYFQRLNHEPTTWILVFATVALLGYLLYLVGNGMTL